MFNESFCDNKNTYFTPTCRNECAIINIPNNLRNHARDTETLCSSFRVMLITFPMTSDKFLIHQISTAHLLNHGLHSK